MSELFLFVVLAVLATDVLTVDLIDQLSAVVETYRAFSVAAVPEVIVQLFSVGCFIIDQQHVLFSQVTSVTMRFVHVRCSMCQIICVSVSRQSNFVRVKVQNFEKLNSYGVPSY